MNIQWNIHKTPIFYYKYFAKLDPYHESLVSVSVLLIYFVSGYAFMRYYQHFVKIKMLHA